jgi:hypothetical protein
MDIKTWEFVYVVGNTYKVKRVKANNIEQAFKRARLGKSVVDLNIVEYEQPDKYQLRDF